MTARTYEAHRRRAQQSPAKGRNPPTNLPPPCTLMRCGKPTLPPPRAERPLAIALAGEAIDREEPTTPRSRHFVKVQTAKAAHRLASGYHRKFDWKLSDGSDGRIEVHKYARSPGRVLVHMGTMLTDAA